MPLSFRGQQATKTGESVAPAACKWRRDPKRRLLSILNVVLADDLG